MNSTLNKEIYIDCSDNKISFNLINFCVEDFNKLNFMDKNFLKVRTSFLNGKLNVLENLRLSDYEKIISIFENNKDKLNISNFIKSPKFKKWFEEKKIFIEKKAKIGKILKDSNLDNTEFNLDFIEFKKVIEKKIVARKLNKFQMKNAFYLYKMKRASNFSVPGSGKTTVCLATFAYLQEENKKANLVIFGPKNCFKSWRDEFYYCFNRPPTCLSFDILKNIDVKSLNEWTNFKFDILFFNYEIIPNKLNDIKKFINEDSLIIFDEIHKIKANNGKWANACKEISSLANYRIALTGTPTPNGYQDIYNILEILYKEEYDNFFRWDYDELKSINLFNNDSFKNKIYPFFIRTSKEELNVPKPNADNIINFSLSHEELKIYEKILYIYRNNSFSLYIRLLQLMSCPNQLLQKIDINNFNFDENIKDDILFSDKSLDPINSLEVNEYVRENNSISKIDCVINLIKKLKRENKKILLWTIFIEPMNIIQKRLEGIISSKIINGNIKQSDRDKIIDDFRDNKIDLLISNPQTLAESVSLHQCCHDAIYLEFSYNLTHMLQSKDRIHRLGINSDIETNYYFLIPNNLKKNIDLIIYNKLKQKEINMLDILNSKNVEISNFDNKEILDDIVNNLIKN